MITSTIHQCPTWCGCSGRSKSLAVSFCVSVFNFVGTRFVRTWKNPLSSDAFSNFGRINENENNNEVSNHVSLFTLIMHID